MFKWYTLKDRCSRQLEKKHVRIIPKVDNLPRKKRKERIPRKEFLCGSNVPGYHQFSAMLNRTAYSHSRRLHSEATDKHALRLRLY